MSDRYKLGQPLRCDIDDLADATENLSASASLRLRTIHAAASRAIDGSPDDWRSLDTAIIVGSIAHGIGIMLPIVGQHNYSRSQEISLDVHIAPMI